MELGNVVGDCGGAIDGAIGARRTWHSKTKKIGASSLLSLVRGKLWKCFDDSKITCESGKERPLPPPLLSFLTSLSSLQIKG